MEKFNAVEILIVEDSPRDAELTVRALTKSRLANHLFVVGDGAEALDFLYCRGKFEKRENSKPKVILLDLKLPKISGLEVLKTIKSDKRLAPIPVVMVTSSREEPDMKEAYNLGVNSYVVKPVDFEQFLNAISSLGFFWLLINESLQ
jgi:CheY-like chemotaxis protein